MLIFRGYGLLVPLLAFGCSLLANYIVNEITGSGDYWDQHTGLVGSPLMCSGGLCWLCGRSLNRRSARRLIDPRTGEEVVLKDSHDLLFVKIEHWGIILGALGITALVGGVFSGL